VRQPPARTPGPIAMRVERLCIGNRVRDVTFTLRHGEVLGIAGLVGSGRTELLRAIFGADRADSGAVIVGKAGEARRFRQPREAIRAGLGMVPEDRKTEGLLLALSVRANLTLSRLMSLTRTAGWIDRQRERELADATGRRVQLRCHSLEQSVQQLSGGNQQKVLIGRWLLRDPEVLLLDEPTRGIDVAAKFAVCHLIDDLAERGKGVVIVSSEIEELMLLCDRIAVLSAGTLVRVFDRGEWTRENLLSAAFAGYTGASTPAEEANR
jgi:ribose transport system ATP-binding protein